MWKGITTMTTAELTRTESIDTKMAHTELQGEELVVLPNRLETTGCWDGCGGWGGWGWGRHWDGCGWNGCWDGGGWGRGWGGW